VYAKPNTVTAVGARRLEWAGNLVRMSDGRAVKEVLVGKTMEEETQEDQN
jgi:hypothetical protein